MKITTQDIHTGIRTTRTIPTDPCLPARQMLHPVCVHTTRWNWCVRSVSRLHPTVTLSFSPLSAPIAEQLDKQGFTINKLSIAALQKAADNSNSLFVAGCLTDTEKQRVNKRIINDARLCIEAVSTP
jgi:hypothetical protein